jgi:hypothetical protein
MNTNEAIEELKKLVEPGICISVQDEITIYPSGKKEQEYWLYVKRYGWLGPYPSFEKGLEAEREKLNEKLHLKEAP